VNDQARALGENTLTALIFADEMSGVAIVITIKKFNFLVGAWEHRL